VGVGEYIGVILGVKVGIIGSVNPKSSFHISLSSQVFISIQAFTGIVVVGVGEGVVEGVIVGVIDGVKLGVGVNVGVYVRVGSGVCVGSVG
jgi:hypothetical protein